MVTSSWGRGTPARAVVIGLPPSLLRRGIFHCTKHKQKAPANCHFYASWCINRKADGGLELAPKVVQARMGHSSITVTMDTYDHLFPRADDSEELAAARNLPAAPATRMQHGWEFLPIS